MGVENVQAGHELSFHHFRILTPIMGLGEEVRVVDVLLTCEASEATVSTL
jgi:hypothetical protein